MLDWRNEIQDLYINSEELRLHESLHQSRTEMDIDGLMKNPRLKLISHIENILGHKIHGHVLDLGAGSGYLSAWLGLNRNIQEVIALECTETAVRKLIPQLVAAVEVENNKVVTALGSFSDIPLSDYFDFIVAFGSLHHSKNLLRTLTQCYKSLKPGAFLVAQEPVADDGVSNREFIQRYTAEEYFAGEIIQNRMREDHFFRLCEYQTALYFSGFDILIQKNIQSIMFPPSEKTKKSLPSGTDANDVSVDNRTGSDKNNNIKNPVSIRKSPYLFVAQKPRESLPFIPHSWEIL